MVVVLALMAGLAMPLPSRAISAPPGTPVAMAIHDELAGGAAREGVAPAYVRRGYQPIWLSGGAPRLEAQRVLAMLAAAADDGLDPQAYQPQQLSTLLHDAADGSPKAVARADVALSRAFAAYAADLHRPKPGADMVFTDPQVARPAYDAPSVTAFLADAPDLGSAIEDVRRMSPPYMQLKAALKAARARADGPNAEGLLLSNLERARALPAQLGARYVLVDAAAQMMWLYEDGRVLDSMPVVVGKVREPTPMMAGLIRYAVLRPYWNVPPDLVRDSIAPRVVRGGVGELQAQNMEVLSDWSADAYVLDPADVDWSAVAAGRIQVRVRQKPDQRNMMGQIKFMFPNRLGIYLHDTPLKSLFAGRERTESAGCVRLADAPRLARWLAPDAAAQVGAVGEPEQRFDLPVPTPVYITYFTAFPGPEGLAVRKDIYNRDAGSRGL